MKKSRKTLIVSVFVVIVVAGIWGFTALNGASSTIDPAKIAVVERGTMSVGRRDRQDRADHEGRNQVEGERHHRGAARRRRSASCNPATCSSSSTGSNLDRTPSAGADANLQAARRRRSKAADAQLKKNDVEAEGPDVEFARRNYERAQQLFAQKLISQSALDDAHSALDVAENRKRAAQSQLVDQPRRRSPRRRAKVAQAQAAVDRADEELANATIRAPIRATVLTRDVEIGSPVSSILNLGANATLVMTLGDIEQVFVRGKVDEADIGRVRLGQPARIRVETFKDEMFNGRVTQISPIGVEKDNVTNFEVQGLDRQPRQGAQGQHDGERRDRARGAPELADRPRGGDHLRRAEERLRRPRSTPARTNGRKRVPVKVGVGNGTKIQVARRPQAGRQGRPAR